MNTSLSRRNLLGLLLVAFAVLWISRCGRTGTSNAPPQNPAAVSRSATLNWDASTSAVVGYNVYRATQAGGPYTRLNSSSSPIGPTSYTDSSVQAGQTYFYVVTAVDANGVESVVSNEVQATVPSP